MQAQRFSSCCRHRGLVSAAGGLLLEMSGRGQKMKLCIKMCDMVGDVSGTEVVHVRRVRPRCEHSCK
jgi:hypothetical protein